MYVHMALKVGKHINYVLISIFDKTKVIFYYEILYLLIFLPIYSYLSNLKKKRNKQTLTFYYLIVNFCLCLSI